MNDATAADDHLLPGGRLRVVLILWNREAQDGLMSPALDQFGGRALYAPLPSAGAIAQLGERLNGIQEVRGSTPLGSTTEIIAVDLCDAEYAEMPASRL